MNEEVQARRGNLTNSLLLTIICVIIVSPPLYSKIVFQIIMSATMALWLIKYFIEILKSGRVPMKTFNMLMLVLGFVFLFLIRHYIDTGSFINGRMTRVYYYCFFAIVATSMNDENIQDYSLPFWSILLLLPIWSIITIKNCLSISELIRYMAGNGLVDKDYYYSIGVMGYDHIYGIVVIIPVLLYLIKNAILKKKYQRIILWINFLLSIVIVFMANYGLAFFTMIIIFVVYFVCSEDRNRNLAILCIIGLLAIVIAVYIVPILKFIMYMLGGTYYEHKILDLVLSLEGQGEYSRIDIWKNCIIEIVRHPLLGIGFSGTVVVNTHSELFYALVYNGIIIGGMELAILFSPFNGFGMLGGNEAKVHTAVLMAFTITSLFDPTGTVIAPLIFIIYRAGVLLCRENAKLMRMN